MITDYLKYVNDQAHVVKRAVGISSFEVKGENRLNMDWVKAWRDHLSCDHVLRTPTHFLFCQTIVDAVIIEENVQS